VPKTHLRIEAYGSVDELNAFIAVLLNTIDDRDDRKFLLRIQYNLFNIGACLATESEEKFSCLAVEEINLLEQEMDHIDALIPPLKTFVLPGGCSSNAWAHVCRTICRRTERCIYRLKGKVEVDSTILKYINRLSDYFFLFSRKQNFILNMSEIPWNKSCL
jgi:cob(I)alamin adenosyltransferase